MESSKITLPCLSRRGLAKAEPRRPEYLMRKSILTSFLIGLLACHIFPSLAEPVSDRITVTVRGKGPDVVLIPGLTCSSAVWDATVARLEGRYRLHIVQVAGFAGAPSRSNTQGP